MNIAWTFLAMAATLFTGWTLLRILWPAECRGTGFQSVVSVLRHISVAREDAHVRDLALIGVRLCLALGVGQAVAAGHYLVWRVACPHVGLLYKLADCLLIPALAWLLARAVKRVERRRQDSGQRMCPPESRGMGVSPMVSVLRHILVARASSRLSVRLLLLVTVVVVSAALCISLARDCYEPLGAWDGWAIWNLKARFLFRSGSDWTAMFSRHIWFSHPDYPLLIPASVARLWTYLQVETPIAPQLVSLAFPTLVISLLFASLAWLRGLVAACISAILLVSYEPFLQYGGAQMADIPLSFYFLAAIVVLAISGRLARFRRRLVILAGVLIGCALLVKNEAQPMTISLLVAMAIVAWLSRRSFKVSPSGDSLNRPKAVLPARDILRVLIGAAPCLLVLAAQKFFFAGSSYLVADQPSIQAVFQKVFDSGRHQTILGYLLTYDLGLHLWRPFAGSPVCIPVPNQPALLLLLALPLACGLRHGLRDCRSSLISAIAIALVFVTYYAVFLIMPYELQSLLESFPRVQLHLWPALIFTVLLVTRFERTR